MSVYSIHMRSTRKFDRSNVTRAHRLIDDVTDDITEHSNGCQPVPR